MAESTAESLYKRYESLPLVQQLALGVAPGTGEVISAYETPKFAGETVEAFDKGEYLEAAGKGAMTGLSALGAIPFVGAGLRAVKGGIKAATKIDEIGEGLSSIFKSEKKLQEYGDTWKVKNKLPDNQRQVQDPIVKQAAEDLDLGKIKGKQFRDTVKEVLPIKPIDEMIDIPTFEEMAGALKKDQVKKGIVGVNKEIPEGTKVATRLDIPAYNNYDKWIVSIHEGIKGSSTGYSKSARLKNVNFGSSTKGALRVAKGADKATFARMEGNWTNTPDKDTISFAERLLKNKKDGKYIDDAGEEWVQVGMNPYRGSYFYDKATGQALQAADELIQVGPLVFAKGSRKPTLSEYKKGFTTTTEAGNKVAFAGGGQVSDGLDNLYMNRRDSKQKLDGMIGIQSRQYGGGLDDAYMNRRSAFAAPDVNSAFASPMGRGGLPTIYRDVGGTADPGQGGDFNTTTDEEDSYRSGDLGDGNYFTDPGLVQSPSRAVPSTPSDGDDQDEEYLTTLFGIKGKERDANFKAFGGPETPQDMGPLGPSEQGRGNLDLLSPTAYNMLMSTLYGRFGGGWQGVESFIGNMSAEQLSNFNAAASGTSFGGDLFADDFSKGYRFGGAAGTLQDILEKDLKSEADISDLTEQADYRKKYEEEFEKSQLSGFELSKAGLKGIASDIADLTSIQSKLTDDPFIMDQIEERMNERGLNFQPVNSVVQGLVGIGLGMHPVGTLLKGLSNLTGGGRTIGTVTKDGLEYNLSDTGKFSLNRNTTFDPQDTTGSDNETASARQSRPVQQKAATPTTEEKSLTGMAKLLAKRDEPVSREASNKYNDELYKKIYGNINVG